MGALLAILLAITIGLTVFAIVKRLEYLRNAETPSTPQTGPTGPRGKSPPGQVGPAAQVPGTLGFRGYAGPVGKLGPKSLARRAASYIGVAYIEESSAETDLNGKDLYILSLDDNGTRKLSVENLDPSIFEVDYNTPGYFVSIVFKRPTSGPPTLIGGSITFSADCICMFAIPTTITLPLCVGYSLVTDAPLTGFSSPVTCMGLPGGFLLGNEVTNRAYNTVTIPFVVSVPSGSVPVHFFSYIDLRTASATPNGVINLYSYCMEIHLL